MKQYDWKTEIVLIPIAHFEEYNIHHAFESRLIQCARFFLGQKFFLN